jgi:hypothetical protein
MIWHAWQTVTFGDIFKEEFVRAGRDPNRVVTTLGSQFGNWVHQDSLPFLNAHQRNRIDALASAAYFGENLPNQRNVDRWSIAQGIQYLDTAMRQTLADGVRGDLYFIENVAGDNAYGRRLRYLGYEGNHHFVGPSGTNTRLKDYLLRLTRSPEFEQLMVDYLAEWKRLTGDAPLNLYSSIRRPGESSSTGMTTYWGIWENVWQPYNATPSARAVDRFMTANP